MYLLFASYIAYLFLFVGLYELFLPHHGVCNAYRVNHSNVTCIQTDATAMLVVVYR